MRTVLTVFGTRPEIIKLAPVLKELGRRGDRFRPVTVASGQHTDLLLPFLEGFGVRIDHDLCVMRPGQSPVQVLHRVLEALDPLLEKEKPDLLLVQGDTTTALAAAMAAFHRRIPIGHVEAGLRSGDASNPFPEEMNRRMITRLAALHFAATGHNVEILRREGVPADQIVLTGNPVVDSLREVLASARPGAAVEALAARAHGKRLIVLTTHRRESFGEVMGANLEVLRDFVAAHEDVMLAFPVHPNPNVRDAARAILDGVPRIALLEPLPYADFVHLLSRAWLIVSDSGGVQEEAPSLGRPLLVLRENTERPEALDSGVARLVGGRPERLRTLLEEAYGDDSWVRRVAATENPFGRGDAGIRIVQAIEDSFAD